MSIKRFVSMLLLLLTSHPLQAQYSVIVHASNHEISTNDIKRIYLGQMTFMNNGKLQVYEYPVQSELGQLFRSTYLQISSGQYRATWARNIFTGRTPPPKMLIDDRQLIAAVAQNKHAIAYIHSHSLTEVDDAVRVIANFP